MKGGGQQTLAKQALKFPQYNIFLICNNFLVGDKFGVFGVDSVFSSEDDSSGSVSIDGSKYFNSVTGEKLATNKLRALSKKASRLFSRQSYT